MNRGMAILFFLLFLPIQHVLGQVESYYQIEYLSYVGGEHTDYVTGIALDSQENIIVLGYTNSEIFPFELDVTTDQNDIFLAKLSPQGSLLFFVTFGGTGYDAAYDLAIDSKDNIWVIGVTASNDLPVTYDAFQNHSKGGLIDAFIVCFTSDGEQRYASYLGGHGFDSAFGIDLDSADTVYLCGMTDSFDFPLVEPIQNESMGMSDLFLIKIGQNRSELEFSSYLGASGWEGLPFDGSPLTVSDNGRIAITGSTNSTTLFDLEPVTDEDDNETENGFICVLNGTKGILWSDWILYEANETGTSVCFDESGVLYVTGVIRRMLPHYISETQFIYVERYDIFVHRYDLESSTIANWTVFGIGDEYTTLVSMKEDGNLVVSGSTNSQNFPRGDTTTEFAYGHEGFLTVLNSTSLEVMNTAFIGGADDEHPCYGLMDCEDRLIFAGSTDSIDLQVTREIQDVKGDYNWGLDGFVGIIVTFTPVQSNPFSPILLAGTLIPTTAAIIVTILIIRKSRKSRFSN